MDIDIEDVKDEHIPYNVPRRKETRRPSRPAPPKSGGTDPYYKAASLYRRKDRARYLSAIEELLNPYTGEHPDHHGAWKLLGAVLIENKMPREARRAFDKVAARNKNDAEALNALAYIELMEGRIDAATSRLLDALFIEENNPRLKANLERLRSINDTRVFLAKVRPQDFIFIELPRLPLLFRAAEQAAALIPEKARRPLFITTAVVLGLAVLVFVFPYARRFAEDYAMSRGIGANRVVRPSIKDIDTMTAERAKYSFKLAEDDVRRKFEMARQAMEERRYNRARIIINELLHSNASDLVKERVTILRDMVPDVTENTVDFQPQVQDVYKTPFLYEGIRVRWSGTIANHSRQKNDEISFDLLINYVADSVVDGITEVHFATNTAAKNGQRVTVFGTLAGINLENKIIMKGISVTPIGQAE